jgi:MoaA/NifB/PqqE/SkfB family radical SAM enzyme
VGKALSNKIMNNIEFEKGRLVLESFPSVLRIGVESRCNIKPRCVYCDWERAKSAESVSDFTFSLETLQELGEFYHCVEQIGELGHGEPMLHPDFMKIIEEFDRAGKLFSFASNGQLLGTIDVKGLLGKDLEMHISIDSSNAEGYARYRNDRFGPLIKNLRSFCRRKKTYGFPAVISSFIAMKSNVSEFGQFVDLMKDIGVDGIRVMTLAQYPGLTERIETRNGFRFCYKDESLSFAQLKEFAAYARLLAERKAMPFFSIAGFGGEDKGHAGPICSEPWKSINVVKGGLFMCCNNRIDSVAKWKERDGRTVEQFLLDTWNGEKYQEIRRELAEGRFPDFCLRAGECPIVMERIESGHL